MIIFTLVTALLLGLVILGIWIANRAARLEEEREKRTARLRQLRNHAADIEDLIKNLTEYEDNLDLLRILTSYLIGENEERYALDPDNEESVEDLQRSKLLLESFAEKDEDHKIIEPQSDHEVMSMRRYLAKAIRVLKYLKAHQQINETLYLGHTNRLKIKALNAEVNAYLKQGDECKERQDNMAAATYYKHAKEILVASELHFEEKSAEIKRISKLIATIYQTDHKKEREREIETEPVPEIK